MGNDTHPQRASSEHFKLEIVKLNVKIEDDNETSNNNGSTVVQSVVGNGLLRAFVD